ncbi:MAG: putative sulfate exporter family transporter [Nitrososphaerota archaeon]|nr:putative sulfate exporter family transporter [Nitrososphaerota archaeon]
MRGRPRGAFTLQEGEPRKKRIDWSSLYRKEDWWAVWLGLLILVLSVPSYLGVYVMGWDPAAVSWTSIASALSARSLNPWAGLALSFFFIALLLVPATRANGVRTRDWLKGFAIIFLLSWAVWIVANYSPVVKAMGSPEVGFVFALVAGIAIANLTEVPRWLLDSARVELFIKVAIVLLGAKILLTTFATSAGGILLAVFLSFPAVWLFAFFTSRRSGLDRDLSATLSSGVGVCGIAASIATAAAIDAPPIYASLMSSVIVVFSAVEIIAMPFLAAAVFPGHYQAAGVWMGLSVKTDGAASASGSVVDGLLNANGSSLAAAVQTKVMIDIWIGLIAFVLATVWAYKFGRKTGEGRSPRVVWYRFPKFVLGYFAASALITAIALTYPTAAAGAKAVAPIISSGTDPLRTIFFAFTFLSIGLNTKFSKFREIGIGKPALIYGVSLAFAILWGGVVAYLIFG